jgi:hypothetical protein
MNTIGAIVASNVDLAIESSRRKYAKKPISCRVCELCISMTPN